MMPAMFTGALPKQEERGPYEDGIHEGTGLGYRGATTLSVAVEKGYITSIEVLEYMDDRRYFVKAAEGVIPAILQSQSLEVDGVTGATYSKNAIIKAVADALDIPEDRYTLQEERPRSDKDKKKHHITQKHIQTKEEYDALTAQYKDIYYNADGILVKE